MVACKGQDTTAVILAQQESWCYRQLRNALSISLGYRTTCMVFKVAKSFSYDVSYFSFPLAILFLSLGTGSNDEKYLSLF